MSEQKDSIDRRLQQVKFTSKLSNFVNYLSLIKGKKLNSNWTNKTEKLPSSIKHWIFIYFTSSIQENDVFYSIIQVFCYFLNTGAREKDVWNSFSE